MVRRLQIKVKKIGKYTYCFDKTGKLVTNKPYYKVNSKTYYKDQKEWTGNKAVNS